MQAGKLRDRITVEERSQTQDDFGAPLNTWTALFEDWAGIEELSGREYFSDARIAADVDTRITMRYRDGITPVHRIVHEDHIYDIKHVIRDPRKTQLELMCKRAA